MVIEVFVADFKSESLVWEKFKWATFVTLSIEVIWMLESLLWGICLLKADRQWVGIHRSKI